MTAPMNRREAIRYPGWAKDDFGAFRTYAYDDTRAEPAVRQGPVPRIAGDPLIGRRLFLDRSRGPCTGCHLVAADQKATTTDAPPFASIARRPNFDPAKIEFFLRDPHPKMPNMTLGRSEAADIAAYIATLK